ncbi:hypothetical protein GR160_17910 [Flavobacterium sp. Sd200]|uniref:hypothetical protein n=1 Tax=Flavobacterium sp. Sd200 TaxID=2692211 RepID=UPI00136FBB0C|nr:hypothetical protein [Flavobacterium sp. Sd200]MXN93106.1 hypothetical protein [Flavobacterium sp. Sd200]
MKKSLFKIFMWVSLTLLCGYSNIDAHVNPFAFSSLHAPEDFELSDFGKAHSALEQIIPDSGTTVKSADGLTFKQNDKTELTDNENEEEETSLKLNPSKKLNTLSAYTNFALFTTTPSYFCDKVKINLPVCRYILNFPSQKLHVIFRVFRI